MSLGVLGNALVERYAAGVLPSFLARQVERRVHVDESWARRYHELRVVDRALSSSSSLSRAQLDALTARVLAGAAPPLKSAVRPWLAFAGAAACAAVVLVVVARPPPDELHARGSTSTKQGLHVRCLANGALVSEADVAFAGEHVALRCAKGSLLAFSATNTSSAPLSISLKLDGDNVEEPSAQANAIDAPLANGIRVDSAGTHAIDVVADGAVAAHIDVEVTP